MEFKLTLKEHLIENIKMSAERDNLDAMLLYGCMLLKGKDVPADKEKGIEYIQMYDKDNENDNAMLVFGEMLETGDEIPIDIAIEYYQMDSKEGNEDTDNALSSLLDGTSNY